MWLGVAAVSAGGEVSGVLPSHTCAVTTGGQVKCWGDGAEGQLGNGAASSSNVPVDVQGLTSGVRSVSAGGHHSCAVTTDDMTKCWGANLYGQLGDATSSGPEICGSGFPPCSTIPVDVLVVAKITPTPTATPIAPTATPTGTPQPPVGGISIDGAALSPDRTGSHRSAAFPFAALALLGVSSAVGAIWFARRRLLRSR